MLFVVFLNKDYTCKLHPEKTNNEEKWDKQFGDRINELVLIGQDMDKEQIINDLQNCLCTADEIKQWKSGFVFEDNFPLWELENIKSA